MIHFDKKTLFILWYIKRKGDKGATWGSLRKKFGKDEANIFLLESLSRELYTVTQDQYGKWISRDEQWFSSHGDFRSFCTPKGNELVELRLFNFWKWIVPTIISTAALVVSALTALLK